MAKCQRYRGMRSAEWRWTIFSQRISTRSPNKRCCIRFCGQLNAWKRHLPFAPAIEHRYAVVTVPSRLRQATPNGFDRWRCENFHRGLARGCQVVLVFGQISRTFEGYLWCQQAKMYSCAKKLPVGEEFAMKTRKVLYASSKNVDKNFHIMKNPFKNGF